MKREICLTTTGGLDSTTLLYRYARQGRHIFPVYVDYGQSVCEIVPDLVNWHIGNLIEHGYKTIEPLRIEKISLPDYCKTPPLFTAGYKPHKDTVNRLAYEGGEPDWQNHPNEAKRVLGWVETRNLSILTAAARWAAHNYCDLVTGFTPTSAEKGDCSEEFCNLFSEICQYSFLYPLDVFHPFQFERATKNHIVSESKFYKIDLNMVYVCDYFPACGQCYACKMRLEMGF